jgi:hypothetical protein
VPAIPSSPIPAALAHLTPTDHRQLQDAEAPHLLAYPRDLAIAELGVLVGGSGRLDGCRACAFDDATLRGGYRWHASSSPRCW